MKERSYDILTVNCNMADIDSCSKTIAEVQTKVDAVDVLINNAGITQNITFKKMDKIN